MPPAHPYPVPALEKGLDLLEALAAAPGPRSLAELAADLDRSSSELFRMLNCLEQRGYVTREIVPGRYVLTLRLMTLAHARSATATLVGAAREPMQQLTERCGESCHLSVLERGRLVVVAQQESAGPVRLSIEVGGVHDPLATASGRLLLAFAPEAERDAVLARAKGLSAASRRALVEGWAKLRRDRVETADSETIEGVRDLAVLVGRAPHGVAALTVTRLRRRRGTMTDGKLLGAVREAAADITRRLGLAEGNLL